MCTRPTAAPDWTCQYLVLVLPSMVALSKGKRPLGLPEESKSPESGASIMRVDSAFSETKLATCSTHRPKFMFSTRLRPSGIRQASPHPLLAPNPRSIAIAGNPMVFLMSQGCGKLISICRPGSDRNTRMNWRSSSAQALCRRDFSTACGTSISTKYVAGYR